MYNKFGYNKFLLLIITMIMSCSNFEKNKNETNNHVNASDVVCDNGEHQRKRMEGYLYQWRLKAGLTPFMYDSKLYEEAQAFSLYLVRAKKIQHVDENGRGPLERVKQRGLIRAYVGQTLGFIEKGKDPVLTVVKNWAGHQREANIILGKEYVRAGYALSSSENGSGCYIVLVLSD